MLAETLDRIVLIDGVLRDELISPEFNRPVLQQLLEADLSRLDRLF